MGEAASALQRGRTQQSANGVTSTDVSEVNTHTKRRPKSRRVGTAPLAVDLFAGCGGLTSGLRAAGFDVVAAIEKDSDAASTYAANHRDVLLYQQDIRRVSAAGLLRALDLPRRETLDLIAGCPPCQGFTRLTEKRRRRDPRNALISEFLRFVTVLRPKACMLENVPGLLTRGKRYFSRLCEGLRRAGYYVEYDVVELADYGVPQFRKRLIVLGVLHEPMPIPEPTHGEPGSRRRPWKTVRNAIGKLPSPPARSVIRAGQAVPLYQWHYARDISDAVRLRLKYARRNGIGRKSFPASLRLACHNRRPDGFYDVYGVMVWDRPAPTITSGCTNASKGRFGHPAEARPVTAVEAALLQTFPTGYKFKGSGVDSVAAQIGNALPRRFARVVGKAIRLHLLKSNGKRLTRRLVTSVLRPTR
jgi:DNA (cytosine-5)-methyltransferase 1